VNQAAKRATEGEEMKHDTAPNLTIERRIVKPIGAVSPQPDHDLVVFRRIGPQGQGRRFRALLGPEDSLLGVRLSRLVSPSGFVAFAVTRDHDLRHEFSREVTTWDRVGTFTLRCRLILGVADPQLIAEQLDEDPLRRLEEGAEDLFVHAASRVDWATIASQGVEFERKVLASESVDANGITNLVLFKQLAARKGFLVHNVELAVTFSPEFGKVIKDRIEQSNARQLLDSAAETKKREIEIERTLEGEREKLRQMQTAQESLRTFITNSAQSLDRILANLADRVTTPQGLRHTLAELFETFDHLRRTVSGDATAAALDRPALRDRLLRDLTAATSASHPAVRRIEEVAALAGELLCAEREKERLLSVACHFIGELALGSESDGIALERYRGRLREEVEAILPVLETAHRREQLAELSNLRSLDDPPAGGRT
jgi:hypothetical protein